LDVSIAEHLDMLADDAMLARPAMTITALRLVGSHRIEEIGAALVKLLDSPEPAVRASAAERISELGVPVAAADLVAKLGAIEDPFTRPGTYTHRDLLSALSARDPAAAWPLLRAVLDDARWARHPSRDTALACAAASDRDEARAYVTAIFTEGALPRLLPLLRAMSTEVASAGSDADPATRQRLAWWVPELIDTYAAGRSSEARRFAQAMLTTITGVQQEAPTEAVDGLAARYEEWLGAHRAEIGR